MPATSEAVNLTNAYRARLLAERQATVGVIATAWRDLIDPADIRPGFDTWLSTSTALTEASKRRTVMLTDVYLTAFMSAELGAEQRTRITDPEQYQDTLDGRPVGDALAGVLLTVLGGIGAGYTANRALQIGLGRATRTIGEEVIATPRRSLGDAVLADDQLDGQRRVVSANACGACLALANGELVSGATHKTHTSCRCLFEPVVHGVPDRFRRPTGEELFNRMTPEEQADLFLGRGGKEKAELVSSGQVPFEALAIRSPQVQLPDQFSEASLADLRSVAKPA